MKQLLLLRHAKSSWSTPGLGDFDRPLKDKGRRAAALIASHLQEVGSIPDAIVSSPALRARETAESVALALNNAPAVSFEESLYEAPTEAIIQAARSVSGDPGTLMLVGHNPSIHLAALKFTEAGDSDLQAELLRGYPTAALASFAFGKTGGGQDRWSDISWSDATLTSFVSPKLLLGGHSPQ